MLTRTALAAIVAAALSAVVAAPALAAVPSPTRLAVGARVDGAPVIAVDAAGGVAAAWLVSGSATRTMAVAYRAKGAKAFGKPVTVPLPPGGTTANAPIWVPSPVGQLRVLFSSSVNGQDSEWVARSADRGATWTVEPLPLLAGKPWGFFRSETAVADDVGVAGLQGTVGREQLITISPDLTTVTAAPWLTSFIGDPKVARAGDGGIFVAGSGERGAVAWQTSTGVAGTTAVDLCTDYGSTEATVAAGAADAVVVATRCGTAYAFRLGRDGTAGAVQKLGPAAEFRDPVRAVHDAKGFLATWIGPDGDLHQARSADGGAWKAVKGAIPASRVDPESTISASIDPRSGWTGWFLGSKVEPQVWAAAPDVARPAAPKLKLAGVTGQATTVLGSTAFAAPKATPLASLDGGGTIKVRLAVSVPDTVRVSATAKLATFNAGLGTARVQVTPGKTRVVSLRVSRSAVSSFSLRKGTRVEFTVEGRNGKLTIAGRLT